MKKYRQTDRFFLCLALALAMTLSLLALPAGAAPARTKLIGTWYGLEDDAYDWEPLVLELRSDGTFVYEYAENYEEGAASKDTFTYDNSQGILTLTYKDGGGESGKVTLKNGVLKAGFDSSVTFCSSLEALQEKKKKIYRESIDYLRSLADKDGWYIKDGVLIGYYGTKKKVTVPSTVKTIARFAFSHADILKLTVPGTCKTLRAYALAEMGGGTVILKQGVKKIGDSCFSDTYVTKLYLPKSVKSIGDDILFTEEGIDCDIYLYKGSAADDYFITYEPYGESRIHFR